MLIYSIFFFLKATDYLYSFRPNAPLQCTDTLSFNENGHETTWINPTFRWPDHPIPSSAYRGPILVYRDHNKKSNCWYQFSINNLLRPLVQAYIDLHVNLDRDHLYCHLEPITSVPITYMIFTYYLFLFSGSDSSFLPKSVALDLFLWFLKKIWQSTVFLNKMTHFRIMNSINLIYSWISLI